MAVCLDQIATSRGGLVLKANRHVAVLSEKKIKKKIFHVDGNVGNTFPRDAKWELIFF